MPDLHPSLWVLAVGLLGAAAVALAVRVARVRRGWWVETLSSAQLRGAADELAVVYHEGECSLWLRGKQAARGARARLEVPVPQAWGAAVEPWARGRRGEILKRVRTDTFVRRQVEPFE